MTSAKQRIKAGIDIGSVTTKCVVVQGRQTIASHIIRTAINPEQAAREVLEKALGQGCLSPSLVDKVVSTGYGRRRCLFANQIVTEVTAAAAGAYWLNHLQPALVIDVGGQDTKVILVGKDARVVDFLMNDKCAAGTGRFLEMMAVSLDTDIDGLSSLAKAAHHPASINSTCSVFAESEVVSLIAQGIIREDIAAGVFLSIAARIASMVKQFPESSEILFCGGGAKSSGLHLALEKTLNRQIKILPQPQFVVALGAVLASE
ncbi:MAG: acyl-CoA dehydratase activase [Candidatus Omnitrophica bacterium]|nr:acyl-CoA dehydratase activase [Candidatus Omnitrophota bacterium]